MKAYENPKTGTTSYVTYENGKVVSKWINDKAGTTVWDKVEDGITQTKGNKRSSFYPNGKPRWTEEYTDNTRKYLKRDKYYDKNGKLEKTVEYTFDKQDKKSYKSKITDYEHGLTKTFTTAKKEGFLFDSDTNTVIAQITDKDGNTYYLKSKKAGSKNLDDYAIPCDKYGNEIK